MIPKACDVLAERFRLRIGQFSNFSQSIRLLIFTSLLTVSISLNVSTSSASAKLDLLGFPAVFTSQLEPIGKLEPGTVAKFNWIMQTVSSDEINKNTGKTIYDYSRFRNYLVEEIEHAWVEESIWIYCQNGNSRSSMTNFHRKTSLEGFAQKTFSSGGKFISNTPSSAIQFNVPTNCVDLKLDSAIWIFMDIFTKDSNNQRVGREVILHKDSNSGYITLANFKRTTPTTSKSPIPKKSNPVTTKSNSATTQKNSSASPKISSSSKANTSGVDACKKLISQKIYATYGMAEPPFGVTTIKFSNSTNCLILISITGDFIGSLNGSSYRCPVVGNWALEANSRVEIARPGTVAGAESFFNVFPQLQECPGTLNALKNFSATVWSARS